MVHREAEWDDFERDRMLALGIYEAGICECGLHQSQLDDPANNPHTIIDRVCKVCAAIDKYQRVQAEADQKALDAMGKKPQASSTRPSDGRTSLLKPLEP